MSRQLLAMALSYLFCGVEAGSAAFVHQTTYCFYCCGIVTSMMCGVFVVWFLLQGKVSKGGGKDPWVDFEGEMRANASLANATAKAGASGATRLLRSVWLDSSG
mmetsp:Transcript_86553/g.279409  ORF Transcript_86553/g.279409 Transcript_86553/m.279409 type:complete len:104 (-) Transcript_86553:61-372(-)